MNSTISSRPGFRVLKYRLILFFAFALISISIMVWVSGHRGGSTGPIMGFSSWGFFIIRLFDGSITIGLLIFISYFALITGINTIAARFDKARLFIIPIAIHCIGSVFVAAQIGPQLIDERLSSFFEFLILSMAISISYILVDARLAFGTSFHKS